MRYFRDWEAYHWTPYAKLEFEAKIDSGLARGTEFTDYGTYGSQGYDGYDRVSLTGPDADLFAAKIIDDDTDPTNGFRPAVVTARPLPSGTYRVTIHVQSSAFEPCNYTTAFNYLDWVVTVTPPTGAHSLHDAFFDPVAFGAAVGADRHQRRPEAGRVRPKRRDHDDHEPEVGEWRGHPGAQHVRVTG